MLQDSTPDVKADPLDFDDWTAPVSDFVITGFPDEKCRTKSESRVSLNDVRDRVKAARAPSKAGLPWLKLARFSEMPTEKGCLRHNAGVLAITGIEADYDGELVSIEEAAEKLRQAEVEALLYTSASHTPAKPRWRVLCLFASENIPRPNATASWTS
jgi:hypothetical protein